MNEQLKQSGFERTLGGRSFTKICRGLVKSCIDPDSDHLHITETEIDGGETYKSFASAPNIEAGQKSRCRKAWRDDARWTNGWWRLT